MGVLSMPPMVRSLGSDREVFWREAGVGASSLAYFLGKCAADLPVLALMAFFFIAPLIAIAPWLAPPGLMYATTLATMLCVAGVGRILSAAVGADIDSTNLIAVNVAILINLFSGWVPLLGKSGGWAYTHWTLRALTALELINGQGISVDMYNSFAQDEWQSPDVNAAIGYLILISLITNIVAYILLVVRFRSKQR
jgi:hypothetical protein